MPVSPLTAATAVSALLGLYHKIYNEQFDAGETFVIAQKDDGTDGDEGEEEQDDADDDAPFHLVVAAEGGVAAGEDVWILEHAFTAPDKEAVQRLNLQPTLVDRLWEMMGMDERIRREEVAAEKRRRAERDEEARREDRKESEEVVEERRRREVDEEKERERVAQQQWTSEESVSCVMSQAEVTRDEAERALIHSRGDLIDAINAITTSKPSGSEASSSSSSSSSSSPAPASIAYAAPPDASAHSTTAASTADLSALNEPEQRAKRVWDALFTYKYAGVYYTTKPREERRALTAADVTAHLYVNDEAGSAMVQAANPNAQLCPLMCVTLNTALSVLWTTRALDQGEEVVRPVRPAVKRVREWTSG